MDKRQMNEMSIKKIVFGGYVVFDDKRQIVFASQEMSDCLLFIEEMMTFDDKCKQPSFITE